MIKEKKKFKMKICQNPRLIPNNNKLLNCHNLNPMKKN